MSNDPVRVDLLAELERIGLAFAYTSDAEWIKVVCPFHDDHEPSCGINIPGQYFKCQACDTGGTIAKLIARIADTPMYVVVADFEQRYGSATKDKPIEPELIEQYHARIWAALPLLAELRKRGVNDETIRTRRYGEDSGRITIPVPNVNGIWVNVLKYLPGANERKFLNMSGRGKPPRIYPIDQLRFDKIFITGGPVKADVAAQQLNPLGVGAICCTGGESAKNWPIEYDRLIAGKKWLGVCLDIDETGVKNAQVLLRRFAPYAEFPALVELPLDKDKYPKGDINDFIGVEHGDLPAVCRAATRWEPPDHEVDKWDEEQPETVTIFSAAQAAHANKRLAFRTLVSAIESEAYYLPKAVKVICDRQQDACPVCPIANLPPTPEMSIHSEDSALLEMMHGRTSMQGDIIRRSFKIPTCKSVEFKPTTFYHAQNALLTQDLDSIAIEDNVLLHSVSMDCKLEINETYDVTSRVVPHPATQRATAIVSGQSTVKDTLAECKVDHAILTKYQPEDWTSAGIARRIDHLYFDYEQHVTRIFERRDLHLLFDLAYHSVLYFEADARVVKGWVEVLAVGDTSQGKTETSFNMMKHYGLGQRVDCKSATRSGLLGGVNEIGGRKFVSWGILPANDRRLVIMEELKGLHPEVMTKLTDMRSSGIAEIPMIERRKAHSRVRLIVLSNTLSGLDTCSYAYGLETIRELIPNLEDIRRFDAMMVLSRQEVSPDVMQYDRAATMNGRAHDPPAYDSISGRNLVLWGWTRKSHEVVFEDWSDLLLQSKTLSGRFVDAIPILDRGSARFKIARLASALAVRTFSHTGDVNKLLVRKCHVQFICEWLAKVYTSRTFGYDRFSEAVNDQGALRNPEAVARKLCGLPFPKDFVECLLRANLFDVRDVCDWCAWSQDRSAGIDLVSFFVRSHAIIRDGRSYRKTPHFIDLLRNLATDEKLATITQAPDYVRGDL